MHPSPAFSIAQAQAVIDSTVRSSVSATRSGLIGRKGLGLFSREKAPREDSATQNEVVVEAKTPSDILEQVKSRTAGPDEELRLRVLPGDDKVDFSREDAEQLADLFRTVEQGARISVELACCGFDDDSWDKMFQAMSLNDRIYMWCFFNNGMSESAATSLAENFAAARQVTDLWVGDVPLTSSALETIALGAENRDALVELILVCEHYVEVTETCLETLRRVKAKWPKLAPFGNPPHGSQLNLLLAMKSIRNLEVELEVQELQEKLLWKAMQEGAFGCKDIEDMLTSLGKKEEERLLNLLTEIMEKYETVGGTALQGLLPPDIDLYSSTNTNPLVQDYPRKLEKEEEQVAWQLSNATYQAQVLQDIAAGVLSDVAPLSGQKSSETYFLQDLVDSVLKRHGLFEHSVMVPSYEIKLPDARKSGIYKYSRHVWGAPAYQLEGDGKSGDWFLYRHPPSRLDLSWGIGRDCGSSNVWHSLNEKSRPTPMSKKWDCYDTNKSEDVDMTEQTSEVSLRHALHEFMVNLADPQISRLLEIGADLVQVRFGPPKALARALQKGSKWLLDLNRCTFLVDSFTTMVFVFLLFRKRVEAKGGRITRFDNFHLVKDDLARDFSKSGGLLNSTLKRPPCLHINFEVKGWTFEVMFLLSDFALVKDQLHKFYDITRAKSLVDLLPPVFPPQGIKVAAPAKKDSSNDALSTKLDRVLEAVLQAGKETQAQLQAQLQATKRIEAQLEESLAAKKKLQEELQAARAQLAVAQQAQPAAERPGSSKSSRGQSGFLPPLGPA